MLKCTSEQELLTRLEHMKSPPGFTGIRAARYLVFSLMLCGSLFVLFLLSIVLSVFLLFAASNFPLWHILAERTWQYQKHIVIDTSLPHMTD